MAQITLEESELRNLITEASRTAAKNAASDVAAMGYRKGWLAAVEALKVIALQSGEYKTPLLALASRLQEALEEASPDQPTIQ